jgi:hypothetical protein
MTLETAKNRRAQTICRLPPVIKKLIKKDRTRRTKAGAFFGGNLEKTLSYLRWKQDCNTLSDAARYIEAELERENLYGLYQKLFPADWKKSTASFHQTGYNENHTEREYEFIELVSERMFPFGGWLDWSDFRFDRIPIEGVNFDLCCGEYEWSEFRPCLQFGIVAFLWRNHDFADDWGEMLKCFKVSPAALPPISDAVPPYRLLEERKDNPKIRRFVHLLEFIFHETGNPFIDTTCCQPVELYEWKLETLEELQAEYKAVGVYFESLASIDEDIGRNARATFRELIKLWNTGELAAPRGQRKNAPDESDDGDKGLLINILARSELDNLNCELNF